MILSVEMNHLFLYIRQYLLDDSWGLQKYQFSNPTYNSFKMEKFH